MAELLQTRSELGAAGQDIHLAVREHDAGWQELDEEIVFDESSGRALDFMRVPEPFKRTVWAVGIDRLAVAPSHLDLAMGELELAGVAGREFLLREHMAGVADRFDVVLVDCPPSLSVLTLNALTAATDVVVPVQAQYYSYIGFAHLVETIYELTQRPT